MRKLNEILPRQGKVDRALVDAEVVDRSEIEDGVCPYCGGAGFVRRNVPLEHSDFGKAFPCRCVQEEADEERRFRLQRYSNLGPLQRITFESIEAASAAVKAAEQFADDPAGWLVIEGQSGSGKTRLAAAIANRCIQRGQPALFMVVPDLLDHLRGAYDANSDLSYETLFEQVCNAPLLILDELGTQSPTPWAQEKLFQLINTRYNNRLPTVFTLATFIDSLDERLRTRLTDPSLAKVISLGVRTLDAGSFSRPLPEDMTFRSYVNERAKLQSMLYQAYNAADPDFKDDALQQTIESSVKSIQAAHKKARDYALEPKGWLVLTGEPGCGKTHLAVAIGHAFESTGSEVQFWKVSDLLDMLRSAYGDERSASQFDKMFQRVRNAPYLILDDLGVYSTTPWAEEKLFQLLDSRYSDKLPTIITIALEGEKRENGKRRRGYETERGGIEDLVPASWASRMRDTRVSTFCEIKAPDMRRALRSKS